jgi:hypothetical protein
VGAATDRGIGRSDPLGCPISRQTAEAAARQGAPDGASQEAVLARVTALQQSSLLNDRLVWLVVLQGAGPAVRTRPAVACMVVAGSGGGGAPTPICGSPFSGSQLVFVDAHAAKVLMRMSVGLPPTRVIVPQGSGGLPPSTVVPVPVPERTAPLRSPT